MALLDILKPFLRDVGSHPPSRRAKNILGLNRACSNFSLAGICDGPLLGWSIYLLEGDKQSFLRAEAQLKVSEEVLEVMIAVGRSDGDLSAAVLPCGSSSRGRLPIILSTIASVAGRLAALSFLAVAGSYHISPIGPLVTFASASS